MQTTLFVLQQDAQNATRTEVRALVLAHKTAKAVIAPLKPALATVSLLQKVCEGMRAWLLARSYLVCEEEVLLADPHSD